MESLSAVMESVRAAKILCAPRLAEFNAVADISFDEVVDGADPSSLAKWEGALGTTVSWFIRIQTRRKHQRMKKRNAHPDHQFQPARRHSI